MYPILKKEQLSENVYSMEIEAKRVAASCLPGQFVIVVADKYAERIPLTIADYDRDQGTITVVVQAVGKSTKKLGRLGAGDALRDLVGPLGHPSDLVNKPIEELQQMQMVFIGGGLGNAPIYPQVRWLHEHGIDVDVIMGARSGDLIFWEDKMRAVAGNVYVTTDDGSYGRAGMVTKCLEDLVRQEGKHYDHCVVIGPMIMMKFTCLLTAEDQLNIPTVVSMNPIMVDGTGMCGACRVNVGDEVKFACVDGPEFDGHEIDWAQALNRTRLYKTAEGRELLEIWHREEEEGKGHRGASPEPLDLSTSPRLSESAQIHEKKRDMSKRIPVSEQDPLERSHNFDEVSYGYNEVQARLEATRCLQCKNPKCVEGCPVSIDIPAFIEELKLGNYEKSFDILSASSCLPAICGRVCPQEEQCEGRCVRGIKGEPVAIGKLERYVADWARHEDYKVQVETVEPKPQKVAIIGSGPAGLACAGDLAKLGYQVTIFESLQKAGGVLQYGIPEFRLPKEEVVAYEVNSVKELGVKIETDVFVGSTLTIKDLLDKEGFEAVFIATGAGLPRFMGIPGENLNGVLSANEYLTRNNLMHAYDDRYDTDIVRGQKVITVGGGNVAMDAARTALRLGDESRIVYRRGEEELPARREEVIHAKEEGVIFNLLQNPIEILGDDKGFVSAVRCIKMELGEPDASGRRRPVPIPGSEFTLACDNIIMALGTNANPRATEGLEDLELNRWQGIVINEDTMATSVPGIFSGGDAVTGSATVILAMGAGRKAAKGIDAYLKAKTRA